MGLSNMKKLIILLIIMSKGTYLTATTVTAKAAADACNHNNNNIDSCKKACKYYKSGGAAFCKLVCNDTNNNIGLTEKVQACIYASGGNYPVTKSEIAAYKCNRNNDMNSCRAACKHYKNKGNAAFCKLVCKNYPYSNEKLQACEYASGSTLSVTDDHYGAHNTRLLPSPYMCSSQSNTSYCSINFIKDCINALYTHPDCNERTGECICNAT